MDFIDMQYGIYGKSDHSLIFIRSRRRWGSNTDYKDGTGTESFYDIKALRFVTPLSLWLLTKKGKKIATHRVKNVSSRFHRSFWKSTHENDTHPSHCQPFSVDEMFHASLSTDCKIRVTSCPPELREMIVALQAKQPQSMEWMCQWSIPH